MVKPVKHQDAQTFDNKACIYLTSNELPECNNQVSTVKYPCFIQLNFRKQNVKQLNGLKMECLIWMMNEINQNINMFQNMTGFMKSLSTR